MGIYAVTGAASGIGAKTAELLAAAGDEVIKIDIKRAAGIDISADLSTPEGRQTVLDELKKRCPDGLDGLICCAGVSGACGNLPMIVSLNFFGTIAMVRGCYELLKLRRGSCVVTVSNAISQGILRMDLADMMNNNGDNELRIRNLVAQLDASDLSVGNSIYVASKYALARWMRRHSASFAANGVRINAVAPGNVNTAMTATMSTNARMALNALPIPTKYGRETLMEPLEIASVNTFLLSEAARGVNGIIMFVDGGTDALLNSEKVY